MIVACLFIIIPFAYITIGCPVNSPLTKTDIRAHTLVPPEHWREELWSYLALPEWYIVYNTEEYAEFLQYHSPDKFPYWQSIAQYWHYYRTISCATRNVYPFDWGYTLGLMVIGESYTVEHLVKGAYENIIGSYTAWLSGYQKTEEDMLAQRTAQEYGAFLHTVPWYEFPFDKKLEQLWKGTPFWGKHQIRKWERKLALSIEYSSKSLYGWLIKQSTRLVYAPEETEIYAIITHTSPDIFTRESRLHLIKSSANDTFLVSMPRYEPFTQIVKRLATHGVRFVEIAGNDDILLTALDTRKKNYAFTNGKVLIAKPVLSDPNFDRIAITAKVSTLHLLLEELKKKNILLEHIYDH